MKVKIFYKNNESDKLESEVNQWLSTNANIEIRYIKQNQSGRLDVHRTISIFYVRKIKLK